MQELQVTAGGRKYLLAPPFFVLATQNPIEQEGTYPLPEAQLDRFMFLINVGYPGLDEEREIVRTTTAEAGAKLEPVLGAAEITGIQAVVRKVPVSGHVVDYALRLVRATRPGEEGSPEFVREWLSWGAGPRAGQYLVLAAKARAVLNGRFTATCNDIRWASKPVLRHRIFTNFTADSEGVTPAHIVDRLLEEVEEPSEKDYR
jgi:MoxR-like ATPase